MSKSQTSFWLTPKGFAALGLIGAVSYFLLVEHRQHLFEFLPYLILLLCPLMHLFMHGNHGHHDDNTMSDESTEDAYQRGLDEGRKQARKQQH